MKKYIAVKNYVLLNINKGDILEFTGKISVATFYLLELAGIIQEVKEPETLELTMKFVKSESGEWVMSHSGQPYYFKSMGTFLYQYLDMLLEREKQQESEQYLEESGLNEKLAEQPKPEPQFKVGDRVKILRGWDNGSEESKGCSWWPAMDQYIGTIGTVTNVNEYGCHITNTGGWNYRFSVLEKVPEPIPLVDGHKYRVRINENAEENTSWTSHHVGKEFNAKYDTCLNRFIVDDWHFVWEDNCDVLADITESEPCQNND